MQKPRISIIGLGKLGAPMVASFASRGFNVIGVDVNPDTVGLVNQGKPPVFEPKLDEYLNANRERISATENFQDAISRSDITFIIVPTPSNKDGGFSTKYVLGVGEKIGKALREKPDFHLVVLTSTVLPEATRGELLPALEKYSGKKCGVGFGLCYNPEFIALGSVIRDILNPDFILIGESDSQSGDLLEEFYRQVCQHNPPVKRMNIINAEISKIALNTYVTTKISYANMLAELCEKVAGGDIDTITQALGCDRRIGHKFLKGAVGYGGPCFPRDNRALAHTARKFGISFPIAEATDMVNKRQTKRLRDLILSKLPKDGKVGILGLAYKPDTDVFEESQGLELAKVLIGKGIPVIVYDPAGIENAKNVLRTRVSYANSLKVCIKNADLLIITTPWEEFKKIQPPDLMRKKDTHKLIVIDCWRILDKNRFENIIDYIAIGINRTP